MTEKYLRIGTVVLNVATFVNNGFIMIEKKMEKSPSNSSTVAYLSKPSSMETNAKVNMVQKGKQEQGICP